MPKCCVPGCRGNYAATLTTPYEKVSIFQFPSDETMKKKWLKYIPRDLEVSKTTVVCEKHFAPQFIIRIDSATRPDGTIISVPRDRPKLASGAYPTIFPNTPSYLSQDPPQPRKNPDTRRAEAARRDDEILNTFLENDKINEYSDLMDKLSIFMKDYPQWNFKQTDEKVCLYKLDIQDVPTVVVSVCISLNLKTTVFKGKFKVSKANLAWILGKNSHLTCWSVLSSILSHFNSLELDRKVEEQIDIVGSSLQGLCDRLSSLGGTYDDDVKFRLSFITEQFFLLFASKNKYSPQTLVFAYQLMTISRAAYQCTRDKVLTLPHISFLNKLSAPLKVKLTENSNAAYLKQKATVLQPIEKVVILLVDEIYVNSKVTYKGGSIVGKAANDSSVAAGTVLTFMICSLLSKNKDVVSMVPVSKLTTDFLKECSVKVLNMVEQSGFQVLAILSDNNLVNRKMFMSFGSGKLVSSICHPCNEQRKLFFLFDSVHLIKSIRNNWIGQSDDCQTFRFPPFNEEDSSVETCAKFSLIRLLYSTEKDNSLKLAPGLTYKSIYPSSIERQNVSLALKVFDEKVIVSLKHLGDKEKIDVSGTVDFLSRLLKLWRMFNIKSYDKGYFKRDPDSKPFKSSTDDRLDFLRKTLNWLTKWESYNLRPRSGGLSNETFIALKHTVSTFIELIPYLLDVLKFRYVLTGKFQTDCLESRFGKYRRLCGTNYHVSVQELLESEKKLRLVSLLNVTSASHGKISITDVLINFQDNNLESSISDDSINHFVDLIDKCTETDLTESEKKVLIFIAGYIAFKLRSSNRIKCGFCTKELAIDKTLDISFSTQFHSYLHDLDRGGLKWPSQVLVDVLTVQFSLFKKLISKGYEDFFLAQSNQKQVLLKLFHTCLQTHFSHLGDCICGQTLVNVFLLTSSYLANILLNNYSKSETDKCSQVKKAKKRKLQTYTK